MKTPQNFKDLVYAIVAGIPRGEVLSYKEVAFLTGRPNAARAVGNILNANRDKNVPCHRVVRSDGSVGGYAWGTKKKEEILLKESAISHLNHPKRRSV